MAGETMLKLFTREILGSNLSNASDLFETGNLEDAKADDLFIKRLNTFLMQPRGSEHANVPFDIAQAISRPKQLKVHAELVAFGRWLLIDGAPSLKGHSGRQPNKRILLKCVAAAMHELDRIPKRKKHGIAMPDREKRLHEITKHQLARGWKNLFYDEKDPSFFDARLKSLKTILSAYLKHVASGAASCAGEIYTSSPEIKRVSEALTGRISNEGTDRQRRALLIDDPRPASPKAFEVQLRYSSDKQATNYRRENACATASTSLPYSSIEVLASSKCATVSHARRIQLVPDLAIRQNYKTTAVIDRIVLLIDTVSITDRKSLHKIASIGGKISNFTEDLTLPTKSASWGYPLPEIHLSKKTGQHFALLIQDPAPDSLSRVIQAINAKVGIKGDVRLHLIEVAVDFYPKKGLEAGEALALREKVVGALHRHHWAKPSYFLEGSPEPGKNIDMRQQFDNEGKSGGAKTRFAFSHDGPASRESDQALKTSCVRERILTDKAGEFLYVNSTELKGAQTAPYQVRIQHKIADERNYAKDIRVDLPEEKCRARIEVTISGEDTLKDRGLSTVADLAAISYRALASPLLSCRVAEIEPLQGQFEDVVAQMETRGVYGIDLRSRARAIERRLHAKAKGEKPPRLRNNPGQDLVSWNEMNDVIGRSLDQLTKRWSNFRL